METNFPPKSRSEALIFQNLTVFLRKCFKMIHFKAYARKILAAASSQPEGNIKLCQLLTGWVSNIATWRHYLTSLLDVTACYRVVMFKSSSERPQRHPYMRMQKVQHHPVSGVQQSSPSRAYSTIASKRNIENISWVNHALTPDDRSHLESNMQETA